MPGDELASAEPAAGQELSVSPVLSDYVLGLARNTISPQMRGTSFAEATLVDESVASMDRLESFTGREAAGIRCAPYA